MMKKLIFLMIVLMLSFLTGCAPVSPLGIVQSSEFYSTKLHAINPSNHDALAKYYEDVANTMKAKLEAQKELFEEYEEHSNYYGRRGQDLQSHSLANMRYLLNSLKENLKEAAIHRKMAEEAEKQALGLINEEVIYTELN